MQSLHPFPLSQACLAQCHRPFFSTADQGDDHGVRIPEDTSDALLGNEAGEAVQVAKSFEDSHRRSMTAFPMDGKIVFRG